MTILIPLLAVVLGALVYVLATANAKLAEMGRLMFGAGVLVTLLLLAENTVHILVR